MPRVTGLRELPRGRVAVELDGRHWRDLPVDAVVRTGIREGAELDRPRLRELARELRRAAALRTATRALRHRDLSRRQVAERLTRAGVAPTARREALRVLGETGVVDDRRLAAVRARALAARAFGDAAIRFRLSQLGLDDASIVAAAAELEPEADRARALAEARGRTAATARWLARRGFSADAVEAAVGALLAADP